MDDKFIAKVFLDGRKVMKISVIVPVYNGEKTIIKCIESVLEQDYDDYQLLLINDGSTDNTDDVIKKYLSDQNSNKNIEYYSLKNGGVSAARNYGLERATGEVITFLDADDYYSSGYFQSIRNNIGNNDILLYGYRTVFNNNVSSIKYGQDLQLERGDVYKKLFKKNLFSPVCNKVYSKKIIVDKKFNTKIDFGEDFEFFSNCLYGSNNIKYVDQIFYNYVIDLAGLGFKKRQNMFKDKMVGLQPLTKMYIDYHYDIKEISFLYVKNFVLDFVALKEVNQLDKKQIKILQNNFKKEFDYKKFKYTLLSNLILHLYLSDCYLLISFATNLIQKMNVYKKSRIFKIKS